LACQGDKATIFHRNMSSTKSIIDGIFKKNYITITCSDESPYIIDCGSHIGISILYFKLKYPYAKILGFEPCPHTFQLLEKNIKNNYLQDVILLNKAVNTIEESACFFMDGNDKNYDGRGSSLVEKWGNQLQKEGEKIFVDTVKLSCFIDKKVDFLKLDIEALEYDVLKELGDKIKLITEIYHWSN
jgi:FkbM family methyltransferase